MRSEPVRPISRWPTEPCTEIRNPSPLTNPGTFRERLVRRETTIMVLVVRVEVLRLKAIQVAPMSPQFRDDLLGGNRVAGVEVEDMSVTVGHSGASTRSARPHQLCS